MSIGKIEGVALRGLVSVVPARKVDNLEVPAELVPARDRLVRNVGIRFRRLCPKGTTFADLSETAARRLLDGMGWDSVDLLIVVTQTPDYPIPGNAVQLQDRLGLPRSTVAFDINLGCSGYPFGVFTAAGMLKGSGFRRALVVVGDQSASDGAADEGREILFSDAATATALELDDAAAPLFFEGYTDGSGYRAIYVPHGGRRNPLNDKSTLPRECEDGIVRKDTDVWLDGPAILNFSTREAPLAIQRVLAETGIEEASVDRYFLHQANRMINETIRKKLRIDPERMPMTLYDFGNTSSASIPLTMTVDSAARLREGKVRSLLCGFGIGLSWGTMVIDTDRIFAPDLIEV